MPATAKLPKLPPKCQWWKGSIRVHIGVPEPLQQTVGATALRRSLRTKDPRVAEYARLPVIKEFEARIEEARLAVNPANVAARITANLRYDHPITRGWFNIPYDLNRLPAGERDAVETVVAEREREFYARNDAVATVMRRVEDSLPEGPFDPDVIIAAIANASQSVTVSLPMADASIVIPFADVLAAWATRQSNPDTKADYRAKLAMFGAFVLKMPLPKTDADKTQILDTADAAAVTSEDAVRYLDMLVKTKSPKTADNHFSSLKAVWKFNAAPGRALFKTGNPFAGIETGLKSDPKERRLPFEPAERDALLIAAKASADPVEKFATLIAGFSGATVSEIVEASPRDVGEVGGVPVLRIRETYRGKNRGLKNDGARARTVPLHPSFAADFLTYAQSRKGGELFPSLKPDSTNGLTDDASEKLLKFIRTTLGYTDHRKVFHSFRHTVATMMEKLRDDRGEKFSQEKRFAITGHAMPKGEGNGYIHKDGDLSPAEVHELNDVIGRLSNPL